jgi:hypothetical protein
MPLAKAFNSCTVFNHFDDFSQDKCLKGLQPKREEHFNAQAVQADMQATRRLFP